MNFSLGKRLSARGHINQTALVIIGFECRIEDIGTHNHTGSASAGSVVYRTVLIKSIVADIDGFEFPQTLVQGLSG